MKQFECLAASCSTLWDQRHKMPGCRDVAWYEARWGLHGLLLVIILSQFVTPYYGFTFISALMLFIRQQEELSACKKRAAVFLTAKVLLPNRGTLM